MADPLYNWVGFAATDYGAAPPPLYAFTAAPLVVDNLNLTNYGQGLFDTATGDAHNYDPARGTSLWAVYDITGSGAGVGEVTCAFTTTNPVMYPGSRFGVRLYDSSDGVTWAESTSTFLFNWYRGTGAPSAGGINTVNPAAGGATRMQAVRTGAAVTQNFFLLQIFDKGGQYTNLELTDYHILTPDQSNTHQYLLFDPGTGSPPLSPPPPPGTITASGTITTASSSGVRRPVLVTLGARISLATPVTSFTPPPSVTVALSTAQKTALGLTATVEALAGLAFVTGARLQKPLSDPVAAGTDPAACLGRVEARVDSGGSVTLYLCPATSAPDGTLDGTRYAHSPGAAGAPYLAAGVWYVWIVFVLSAYSW